MTHAWLSGARARHPRPLLTFGFRPFFLLAPVAAVALVVEWLCVLIGHVERLPFEPLAWHAHEMLFGFAIAAAAGFLLTAVPNWTASPPVQGPALLGLATLWLAGRVVMTPGVGLDAGCVDADLGVLWGFVGRVDAGEVGQFASPGLGVETLDVALFGDQHWRVDVNFAELVLVDQ